MYLFTNIYKTNHLLKCCWIINILIWKFMWKVIKKMEWHLSIIIYIPTVLYFLVFLFIYIIFLNPVLLFQENCYFINIFLRFTLNM
jgi:hypothetical protein